MRAVISERHATREPKAGETWRVTGELVVHPIHGPQIDAEIALPLLPTGEGIIRWIATSRSIPGVGARTAHRLWSELGQNLYLALEARDADALAPHVGPAAARDIVAAFALLADEVAVLKTYDKYGVDPRAAVAACALWGRGAIQRLAENPYCINVVEGWKSVDERALRLGMPPQDDRRLLAAVAEACAARYSGREWTFGGNLANTPDEITRAVARLLAADETIASKAVGMAIEAGELIPAPNGLLQTRGCHLMERAIESSILERLGRTRHPVDENAIATVIRTVGDEVGFALEPDQAQAIQLASTSGFSVIDGGAGTGKSTITLALMRVAQALGGTYVQMALSGRAAKRLREATGHEAMTVYGFLRAVTHGKLRLTSGTVVVDEASMIGTPDLWQILSWLPPKVDVVLIGDPGQLPPISPGRPFEAAVVGHVVPRTTLRRIYRQGADNDLPEVAAMIRAGRLPDLPDFDPSAPHRPGVFILRDHRDRTADAVVNVFEAVAGRAPVNGSGLRAVHEADVQILGATKQGLGGTTPISERIEARWMAHSQPVHDWGLSIGSKILWTENRYERPVSHDAPAGDVVDVMNGSFGIVQTSTREGAVVLFDDKAGTRAEIYRSDLQHIRRGWAVTVHKAQGSAFARVIMPVAKSRMLDRLLVYTAITRARYTAVLVGDEHLLRDAIEAEPRSWSGRQTLQL
jgi:exodeoxyribonuclease V alpha subunit